MIRIFLPLGLLLELLSAAPVLAVPPPPPRQASVLQFRENCPIALSGSVLPYQPATYQFSGLAGDVLVMVNDRPSLSLLFDFGLVNDTPLIADAGFGPDVRIRLLRPGTYSLQVSAYDPIAQKAAPADYRLRLFLRNEQRVTPCPADR